MSWACGRIFFENRPTFRFRSTEIEFWKMIFPLDLCILWVRQVHAVYISLLLWFQTPFFLRWKGAMEHPARNVPCRHGEQKQWRRRGVQRWDINGSSKWEQCYEVLLSGAVWCLQLWSSEAIFWLSSKLRVGDFPNMSVTVSHHTLTDWDCQLCSDGFWKFGTSWYQEPPWITTLQTWLQGNII